MFISIVSRNLLKVGEVIMSAGMILMGGEGVLNFGHLKFP